ncbi:MAG: DUF5110 domain-containing protein [Kordiimonadaceae bacterium]|nr:DUF5110 domain-containing protein [Kordiimonadaceae bacterium]
MLANTVNASGLSDLVEAKDWQTISPGIWKIELGDMSNEIRYTDFAAEPPKLEVLNKKSSPIFPFNQNPARYIQNNDGRIMVYIPTDLTETIYGYGLQLDGIDKSRTVLDLKVDHWGKGNGKTHAPVPFYISSKGYGVFFNTARYIKVYTQVGNRKDANNNPTPLDRNPLPEDKIGEWDPQPGAGAVEASLIADGVEVIIIAGDNMLDIVSRYNLLSGGGALPPLWGLGFWNRVHAEHNADQVKADIAEFSKYNIPLDVVGLEPGWQTKSYPNTFEWQTKRFADPEGFTKDLLKQNIYLNLWQNPYISPEAKIYDKMYPLSGSHMVWLGIVPDYMLPEARKIITDQHWNDHISIGISGYKIDEVDGFDNWLWPDHATFPSGTPGEVMRQTYGLQMQKMMYQDIFKKHNTRTLSMVRASNGAAASHPYALYSDSYDQLEYITGISAASLSGLLWVPEIRSADNGREWLMRFQTTAFSHLAQLNAWSSGTKPWEFDDVTDDVRDVLNLRMQLLPYLYTAFADYNQKGIPPLRAMLLEQNFSTKSEVIKGTLDSEDNPYATDEVVNRNDQYMFGPSILVAPFYDKFPEERDVLLPVGNWYDFYSGELVGNGTKITITAKSLDNKIPLYVKESSVIPMLTKAVINTGEAYGHPLELRLYGTNSGTVRIYEDDGKTFDYQKGNYRIREITVSNGEFDEVISKNGSKAMFGKIEKLRIMTK